MLRILQLEVYWKDPGESVSIGEHVTFHHFPLLDWRSPVGHPDGKQRAYEAVLLR